MNDKLEKDLYGQYISAITIKWEEMAEKLWNKNRQIRLPEVAMNRIINKLNLTWLKGMSALYQVIGNNGKAVDSLLVMIQEGQAGEKEWWSLGTLYVRMQQWDKAVHAFLNAVKVSNGNPKYIYWLGKAQEESGNNEAAEALYDHTLKKNAEFWEAYEAKGQLLLNRSEYSEALSYFNECLKHKERDAYLLNNIGLCYLGLNLLEEARRYLAEAVRKKPGDDHLIYNYATVLVRLADYDNALVQFCRIKNPKTCTVLNALGYCYGMLKQYNESIGCYLEALGLEPENREVLKNLAVIYTQQENYPAALQILKGLLGTDPKDPDLLNGIAWIYEAQAAYHEAEENYYRGLAASEGSPDIAYNLICCLNRQKKYLEALDLTSYLQKIPERHREYWSSLAQIYENLGAANLAVDCYNKSLGLE